MPKNIQLFRLVRRALGTMAAETANPEHRALLEGTDAAINELLLRENGNFYVDLYEQGEALLQEGEALIGATERLEPIVTGLNHPDVINGAIVELQSALTRIVAEMDETANDSHRAYLNRLTDWNDRLYIRQGERAPASEESPWPAITRESLLDYLTARFPAWENLRITRFSRLSGGFSKTTILFETEDDRNGHQAMVIRAEQPLKLVFYGGSYIVREYAMIQLMQRAGIPVAEPLWLEEDPAKLGNRFIVSRMVKGRNYGGNLSSSEPLSEALLDDLLHVLIRIHNVKVDPDDPLVQHSHLKEWVPYRTLTEATRHYVTGHMRKQIADAGILVPPTLERGLRWLERNVPENDEPPAIIHIDYALNNLLIQDDRIAAVLDWESSRFGDPAEELLATHPSLSGNISFDEMLAIYRKNTGREISEFRLCYFRISKFCLNTITILRAEKMLDMSDQVAIDLCKLALPYKSAFLVGLNRLIAEAEAAKAR